jgi:predicted DNA-binding transcriptional regulator AlpA
MQDKTVARRPSGVVADAMDALIAPSVARAISGGISESTQRRLVAAGDYPRPVVLSRDRRGKPVRIAWIEREVRAWVARRIAVDRAACRTANDRAS